MNHILIIILSYLSLVFVFCFYEYYYKKKFFKTLEKFENNSNWDDRIGLQVLRDMLGIFFDESKKSFIIPGGLSVSNFIPVLIEEGNNIRAIQFQRGRTLNGGTRMRYNIIGLSDEITNDT